MTSSSQLQPAARQDGPIARNVIAIAASAGGVQAVPQILQGLDPGLDAAVLVLLHLSPHHKSRLHQVFERQTKLPVEVAHEGGSLRAGHVYVARPAKHLEIDEKGCMHFSDSRKRHFTRPSAEPLFSSVAAAYGPRSILVVLTGGGRNGSDSLPLAHSQGARILVQDPEEAQQPSMPRAAIASGACDEILPLSGMARRLTELVERLQTERTADFPMTSC